MKGAIMHGNNQSEITSLEIAEEIKKKFGNEAETVTVTMKYRRQVRAFFRKIEKSHKKAGKSKLIFA